MNMETPGGLKSDMYELIELLGRVGSPFELMTLRQARIFLTLIRAGNNLDLRRVRGLAAQLGLEKPVITRALATFRELGWITVDTEIHDRRSVLVTVLPAGRAVFPGA